MFPFVCVSIVFATSDRVLVCIYRFLKKCSKQSAILSAGICHLGSNPSPAPLLPCAFFTKYFHGNSSDDVAFLAPRLKFKRSTKVASRSRQPVEENDKNEFKNACVSSVAHICHIRLSRETLDVRPILLMAAQDLL